MDLPGDVRQHERFVIRGRTLARNYAATMDLLEEVLLEPGEGDGGGHLVGGFEAGAAVEGGVVVGGGVPVVGGDGEGPPDPDGVAVGVDPTHQAGPFAQQGFVSLKMSLVMLAGAALLVGDDQDQLLRVPPAAEFTRRLDRVRDRGEPRHHDDGRGEPRLRRDV